MNAVHIGLNSLGNNHPPCPVQRRYLWQASPEIVYATIIFLLKSRCRSHRTGEPVGWVASVDNSHLESSFFWSYWHSDSDLNHAATPCNVRAVDGPYLTSLLGCKHECKWATQAIEVEEGKKKRTERDPQEYRAAGFLTIPSHISSTYLGWILYGRVRRAEPRVKLMHPPLCQNTAGCFIREHHRRALDAALTSAQSWQRAVLKQIHPPLP